MPCRFDRHGLPAGRRHRPPRSGRTNGAERAATTTGTNVTTGL
jgi:hypothetical protein